MADDSVYIMGKGEKFCRNRSTSHCSVILKIFIFIDEKNYGIQLIINKSVILCHITSKGK